LCAKIGVYLFFLIKYTPNTNIAKAPTPIPILAPKLIPFFSETTSTFSVVVVCSFLGSSFEKIFNIPPKGFLVPKVSFLKSVFELANILKYDRDKSYHI
jgi:hypothetical protein